MNKIKMLVAAVAVAIGSQTASAQAVEQGTILIDAYYGFPNLYPPFSVLHTLKVTTTIR